jgi:lipoprotein-releasing system permease protein
MISLLTAYRYLLGTKTEKSVSIMVKVCFFGIAVGAFSLALIVSIMNGFQVATHEKIKNINPEIIIQAKNQFLNEKQIFNDLYDKFPEIESYSSNIWQNVIICTNDCQDLNNLVTIKGIDPINETKINNFAQKITFSLGKDRDLTSLLNKNKILIGEKLAKNLNLGVGDEVNILIPQQKSSKINFVKVPVIITGLFNTGIEEFDTKLIVSSNDYLLSLFKNYGISQIGLKLKNNIDEKSTISKLKKHFKNVEILSWKDLYPALVSALELEKYAMFFILILITLVASSNIISLLFMLITQKKGDIAIFKSMGMENKKIKQIFLIIGLIISFFATLFGLLFAFIVGTILDHYPFITLPDVYYVTYLPIKMDLIIFIEVFAAVMLISLIAILIPIKKINNIDITKVLKTEA